MRCETPVFLSSPATMLGEEEHPVQEAVADGLISARDAERYGYAALTVSDLAPVELAERSAALTLAAAALPADAVGLLLHAWTFHQGHEFWSPAHYVADRIGAYNALPLGIQQMCNGGLTAVDQAVRNLTTDPGLRCALVTTGDCFAAPGFDRWGGDLGVAYGDGATSVLVTREPLGRAARLLATATTAAAELEGMHRGDAPFSAGAHSGVKTVLPRTTKKEFHTARPAVDFGERAGAAVTTVVGRALEAAGVAPDDPRLRAAALPRLAAHVIDGPYATAFRTACAAPVTVLGTRTGHLGAGDATANLADLFSRGLVHPGDLAVLLSAGAGFTWTCAIVEVVS